MSDHIGAIDGQKLVEWLDSCSAFPNISQIARRMKAKVLSGEFSLPSPSPNRESLYREALEACKPALESLRGFIEAYSGGLTDSGLQQLDDLEKQIEEALSSKLQMVDGEPVREGTLE